MERLIWAFLWAVWAMGALLSLIVFIATWAVIAGVAYFVWAALDSMKFTG